jgi:hypothetical protein
VKFPQLQMNKKQIPQPNETALPEAERAACKHVAWLLVVIDSYRGRFTAALNLMMECNEASNGRPSAISATTRTSYVTSDFELDFPELARKWARIAMRDAALTIYHFGRVLDGIVKATRSCPTLLSTIDLDKLNSVQPLFENCFPKANRMRNAVAHAGDVHHSPVSLAKAQYAGSLKVAGVVLSGISGGEIIHGWSMYSRVTSSLLFF